LERLDFVKKDIEGVEIEALEGSLSLLSSHKPRFAIASYHLRDGRRTAETLEQMFRSAGYLAETVSRLIRRPTPAREPCHDRAQSQIGPRSRFRPECPTPTRRLLVFRSPRARPA